MKNNIINFLFKLVKSSQLIIALTYLLIFSYQTTADIKVFACEPEWEALVIELGGEKVAVFSATNGLQDPHQVQARPSLISKMRNADLLICSGADLEVGWLPLLLRRASNPKLQESKPGYFLAANHVRLLGIPKSLDRSQGDMHAAGNPHVQTNPKNISRIAKALVKRIKIIDPENREYYQEKTDHFLSRWKKSIQKWKKQAKKIKGESIIVQHSSWDYLFDFAELHQVATIEEKPGIPATSGHLTSLVAHLKNEPAKIIIRAAYQNGRSSDWLAKRTGLTVVALPFTVGGDEQSTDLFTLYDRTFDLLVNAISEIK